jgi:HEAT repeat protein
MDDSTHPPPSDRLVDLLEQNARKEAIERLDTVQRAPAEDRKATVRSLRRLAEDRAEVVGEICPALTSFLRDEERSVRLTTAKLFVALAEAVPDAVAPVVSPLADRLADEGEFYYVRARAAEALGYVALEHPEAVDDPAILADLRVGLAFDEPEVEEKLSKALEYVALGDPGRLRHQVGSLVGHLDDERELVRYHLSTALVAIGCEHPEKLSAVADALEERLGDESPYVRGRVAEALAVLAQSEAGLDPKPDLEGVDPEDAESPSFLTDCVSLLRRAMQEDDQSNEPTDGLGTIESIRGGTDDVVEKITTPDGGGECQRCGLALPEGGPPMCPRCGAPR